MKKLISVEGVDFVGKSTLVYNLVNYFNSKNITNFLCNETDSIFGHYGKFGFKNFNSVDLIYFWWLARIYEQKLEYYQNADIVIKDRHYDSTYVYLYNYFDEHMYYHNYDTNFFNKPDLTILLYTNQENLQNRINKRISEQQTEEHDMFNTYNIDKILKRQNIFFSVLHSQSSHRNIVFIDTSNKTCKEVFNECKKQIESMDFKINQ